MRRAGIIALIGAVIVFAAGAAIVLSPQEIVKVKAEKHPVFTFRDVVADEWVVLIFADGNVKINPNNTLTEGSRMLWRIIGEAYPGALAQSCAEKHPCPKTDCSLIDGPGWDVIENRPHFEYNETSSEN